MLLAYTSMEVEEESDIILDILTFWIRQLWHLNKGSYMSTRVLLNVFNELRILLFRNEFNKVNNTGARM